VLLLFKNMHLNFHIPDKIVIGSYHGILRIFNPKPTKTDGGWSGFKAEDVLLESPLQMPILQIEAGKYVSYVAEICLVCSGLSHM